MQAIRIAAVQPEELSALQQTARQSFYARFIAYSKVLKFLVDTFST
jgi:hypothetical protein